jgi:DNA-binding transcriptional LysR family regulator
MDNQAPRTTLEQWEALRALADHGSFEAAAAAQNRSQSSLSYALKRLQEQLPVAVLAPQGRRTVLTPQGELILQRARALLEEARALEGLAATLAQGWEPEVRLAVEVVLSPALLLHALARFSRQAPQTRVQLIESVLSGTCEALMQRQAGLAVTGQVPPGFLGDPLVQVEFVAVARNDHPLHTLGRTLDHADLRRHRQVVVRDTGRFRQVDSGWLGAEERWTVSHLSTAIAVIRQGLAFAWVPRNQVQDELSSGELKPLPLAQGGTRIETLYLILADRDGAGPAARTLAKMLTEEAGRSALAG